MKWCVAVFLSFVVLGIDSQAVTDERPIVLLMTHPSVDQLELAIKLKEKGLLDIPNLRLVGIRHIDGWDSYSGLEKFLKEAPAWVEVKTLDCTLDQSQVYHPNSCSSTFEQLFQESDGIIFTGGPDIPPALYEEETLLTTVIKDPHRHYYEVSLMAHLLGSSRAPELKPLLNKRPNYLVMGICVGMQTMNIATGGTLIQDIPSELYGISTHEQRGRQHAEQLHSGIQAGLYPSVDATWGAVHTVRLTSLKGLANSIAPEDRAVTVNSYHHQATEKIGEGLVVTMTSLDGKVIEGLRHELYTNVFGVQFHPEFFALFNPGKSNQGEIHDTCIDGYTYPILDWWAEDKESREFHHDLWRMFSERLKTSVRSRPR